MANKSEIHTLFPTVIQVSDVQDSDGLNEHLMKELTKIRATTESSTPDAWSCSLYTTVFSGPNLLEQEEFSGLKDIIIQEVIKYAGLLRLDIDRYPFGISESWVNIYGRKDSQEIHIHKNSVISGIYYVKAAEGCADVLFHSPIGQVMLEPPRTESNPLNTLAAAFSPIPGRMILFRSSVRHSVRPHQADEERVSIAFNVAM